MLFALLFHQSHFRGYLTIWNDFRIVTKPTMSSVNFTICSIFTIYNIIFFVFVSRHFLEKYLYLPTFNSNVQNFFYVCICKLHLKTDFKKDSEGVQQYNLFCNVRNAIIAKLVLIIAVNSHKASKKSRFFLVCHQRDRRSTNAT